MEIKMTADELLEFYKEYYRDGVTFEKIFGKEYDFKSLVQRYSPQEIVMRIQNWRDANIAK